MSMLKIAVEKHPPDPWQRSSLETYLQEYANSTAVLLYYRVQLRTLNVWIFKLDLCEGGSFSTAIFNCDIELSFY